MLSVSVPVGSLVRIGLRVAVVCLFALGGSGCTVSGTTVRWVLFQWACPNGISTKYDLGVSAWEVTHPEVGWLFVVMQTCVSSGIKGSGFAQILVSFSSFSLCFSLSLACLNFFRYGHCGVSLLVGWGCWNVLTLHIRNSAGERPHHGKEVEQYDSNVM